MEPNATELDAPAKLRWWNIVEKSNRSDKTSDAKLMLLHSALSSLNQKTNVSLRTNIEKIVSHMQEANSNCIKVRDAFNALQAQVVKFDASFDDFIKLRAFQRTHRCPDLKSTVFGKSLTSTVIRGIGQSAIIALGGFGLQYATVQAIAAMLRANPYLLPSDQLRKACSDIDTSPVENSTEPITLTQEQLQDIEYAVSTMASRDILYFATVSETEMDRIADGLTSELPQTALQSATDATSNFAGECRLEKLSSDQIDRIITDFVKPGSSYLDERNAEVGEIYGVEAGIGFARGISNAAADSFTESSIREQHLKVSVSANAATRISPTRGQRVVAATKHSAKTQGVGALVSSGIAAATVAGANAGRHKSASEVFQEVGKTLFFNAAAFGTNVGADALRTTLPIDQWGEGKKQVIKAAARVVGRVATQYVKAGVSFATASPGSIEGAALWNVRALMVSVGQGTMKEGIGAGTQVLTSKFLPADEVFGQEAARTLKLAAELKKALDDPMLLKTLTAAEPSTSSSAPIVNETVKALHEARGELDGYLPKVVEAANLKPDSPGISLKWQEFDAAVQDVIDPPLQGVVTEFEPIDARPPEPQPEEQATRASNDQEVELQEVVVHGNPNTHAIGFTASDALSLPKVDRDRDGVPEGALDR